MNDPVHIEVEVVELEAVGVGLGGVDGDPDALDLDGLLLHHVHHHHRVLLRQPPVERRDTHLRRGGHGRRAGAEKTEEGEVGGRCRLLSRPDEQFLAFCRRRKSKSS